MYRDKLPLAPAKGQRKDHIGKIDTAAKFHGQKWGFLNGPVEDFVDHEPNYHSPRSNRNVSMIQNTVDQHHLPEQQVSPSPVPIPSTTARQIGWRTADKQCSLEKYGKYARGQESLHKKFKWPVEGFD
ncbi:unnamed protein product [Didymodactylos carnosus]|uniref:Uncharacterized protein n=1 Tax=Didymodactylos carnosus TaxID=1234261 RepID=A0A814IWK2_9BILA|nr:unnamed protein product [Didymodactylos carnosus]CAF1028867.1 unnamed protein product [Didymodactylos carnosus]CAF3605922.1 unnamed protein product [Didymodactylos carnosus]CAF3799846.1 unnamed protein product [Didymodactylos carnosus]